MVCVWIWPAITVLLAVVTEFAGLVKTGAIAQMTAHRRAVVMLSAIPWRKAALRVRQTVGFVKAIAVLPTTRQVASYRVSQTAFAMQILPVVQGIGPRPVQSLPMIAEAVRAIAVQRMDHRVALIRLWRLVYAVKTSSAVR